MLKFLLIAALVLMMSGLTFATEEERSQVDYKKVARKAGERRNKLAEAHPDELIVVGASVDETSDVVADFIEEKGLTYLIGMDEDYRLAALLFPTPGIPESVFIDPNGVVSSIDIGMMEYDEMEERFQTALGGIE